MSFILSGKGGEKVDKRYTTVSFSSNISDIHNLNSSFSEGILQIAYHGDNHNISSISKDTFERAIPSMFNCPIVCRYIRDEDNLGGHDVEFVNGERGLKMINTTQPVGVVPESASWFWKEVEEDDGTKHEYLCTNVLLWKRQEAYDYISEHGIVGESMEINILSSHKRSDGFMVYDSIEFTAFCLLGEGIEPCFENASVALFNKDDMQKQLSRMMEDFKTEFITVNSASAGGTYTNANPTKGGNEDMNLNELIEKYGLSAEDVNFSTDVMSTEELEARFAQMKAEKDAGNAEPTGEPENKQFSQTACATMDSIDEALAGITYVHTYYDGESYTFRKYYVIDFDMDTSEAFIYDGEDCRVYGFAFTMNGDKAVIDFESKKRKKSVYVDYDEGTDDTVNPVFTMTREIFTACENTCAKLKAETEALRTFKLDTEKAAAEAKHKAEADTVFAKFEVLHENEEFEALKSNYGEMSADEIENKCYAIMGKLAASAKFSLAPDASASVRMGAGAYDGMLDKQKAHSGEPYGGAFVEFNIGQ